MSKTNKKIILTLSALFLLPVCEIVLLSSTLIESNLFSTK